MSITIVHEMKLRYLHRKLYSFSITAIDQTLVNSLYCIRTLTRHSWIHYIVYKHWPDTCEFITHTVELWNRWIWSSCFYNRV